MQQLANVQEDLPPARLTSPGAWLGAEMARDTRWIEVLTPTEIEEIDAAIRHHLTSGRTFADISPETFLLPTLGPRLKDMLQEVLNGRGFVLLRGFPVERYTTEQAAIAYLGIGSWFGSFRSQNAAGHLLGHVRDTGADINQPATRYYQTNRQLEYHTDSCDIVGLMCLKTSKSGGESRIVSSYSIYNAMMERRPDLAAELFHAFPTDRRGEVPDGQKPWFDVPVFNWFDGQLTTIYVGQYIRSAQKNFPQARRLTEREIEALAMLDELANDPQFCLQMEFLPGDIQFLHNHQILHSRTDFEDWPEPERKRHLLRLWLAPKEARALPPSFAARYGSLTPGERGGIIVKGTTLTFALQPA
ncbi:MULTISPECIES: TauD/TfdA family dioxygenase [unclassified Bordetella]|uniref:TauD/TfdA family dioxygenase n=1 Tax=unclassified Bordetella TaxID=2630031 RepID=UPI001323CC8B|nr:MULTISPECIES: TauD/TfdA family dioxygenase [unclassified Bordetella]MVW71108.1 TauD/TfdA family dioxygenase [Bordetella sp. 15P40C-2]MVW80677.1 TauD/TfdA family dioxygenase [Bordetella sp. 02P26C-1]